MNVYRNDGVSLSQLCERGEIPYAGVSRRKDEEGCGTRDVDTVVDVGVRREGSLPRSNYAARAGRASPHRALSYFKDTERTVYFWWNYAKGIVKTSGRR